MARLAVVCLALLLVPPAVAVAWSLTRPASYVAQVDLILLPSAGSSADAINRDLATHQVLVTRQPVVDGVARTVRRDPDDLRRHLSAEAVAQSNVLRLEVVDGDPDRAQRTAQYLALRYATAANQIAGTSDMARLRLVGAATILDQPVGPKPLQAAAAGTLLGLVLLAGLFALLRLRPKGSGRLAS
jgi:uncharacterized protein involved in exopolysaccharide biosynthesis